MTQPAIKIENLGKRYVVNHEAQRGNYRTLRESLVDAAAAPLRRMRGERSATKEEFWALRDVSFEVQPGEVVGIIGRNGAGKSTLLKILSQITKPTKGKVTLNGRVGSLLEVGTGFHPELTGRENIYLNGSILGMSRREIDRKFDEIVDFAEVEKFLDTPVKRYSSGMYVKLAFAVAANLEPGILVIDEVLAVGDADFQAKCLGKMESIARDGKTILLVSHNINSITRLCNRGVVLSRGSLIVDGSTDEAAAAYFGASRSSEVELYDNGISVAVDLKNADGSDVLSWRYDSSLNIDVTLSSERTMRGVAIDLAFYSEEGSRVMAIQSDRLMKHSATVGGEFRQFRFTIENPGLTCRSVAMDVGIREGKGATYAAWWQRVALLPISLDSAPCHVVSGTIVSCEAKVELMEGHTC